MTLRAPKTLVALALQLTALVVLALALLGVSWLDTRTMPRMLVLADRSLSMPRPATDAAIADVMRAAQAAGGIDARLLEFAGRPSAPSAQLTGPVAELQPSATNIERALDAALAAHAEAKYFSAVVISDGLANVGDTARALRAAREARLPIQWIAVGRPPPETRILDVLGPHRVTAGQPIQLTVQLAGRLDRPLRVTATARNASGGTQAARSEPDGEGRATLEFAASGNGAVLVDVVLEDPSSGQRLDARPNAAAIDVTARAAVLYVQGSTGPLSRSLLEGGWTVNSVPATRLDAYADQLGGYKVVVLDDVAISDAGAPFWSALVSAVRDRGVGLVVLGGDRSFARGGYRQSGLESVSPVLSEPAVLDQPLSVVFLVDKSGSMGQGSGGVDRFRLAQRAVLESARGLSERDALGLVVFDVEPRVLIPLGPARAGTIALERDWQATPRGGTKLAPALGTAIEQLERSGAERRVLVVVTDGFIDNAPLGELRARLDRSRIETIALAVGPDADATALERLVGPEGGVVVRVNEAAGLPLAMRSALERRRARVEHGTIAVKQPQPLPFAPAILQDWPAIAAYAVTRARPQASVAVQSERGDPLIAFQTSGQGHVVAVTCGLGRWTPLWMRWPEWPRLAGGLVDWASSTPGDGALALAVADLPVGVQVEADVRTAMGWANPDGLSLAVTTPTAEARVVAPEYVAPGRLRATLPDDGPGLYTFVVSTPLGTQRLLHLRSNRAEDEAWGTNRALDAWRSAGFVRNWNPASLAQLRDGTGPRYRADRWLVGLALALFLTGVVVDRTKVSRRSSRWLGIHSLRPAFHRLNRTGIPRDSIS
jgi:Mg-chelatase subunit ChlD